ncbi:neutral zinc metallopeptidase [Xinfangfangia sp. CPCC 101601]|uniref:Neutral zinc metallopeptidase n=1 Tax=Pseudogemmobacter lacusdianii TaxID=3069608 RepID=A0ABU0VVU9_9RHOB|nr:neutral zinc metallopeptidase [Xinfangfangia sp. CPCC 101601]MDQ2065638.1 neutral zinc metallopeptidase [Xinfangfangia sp. CPCC 101601]
MQWKGRRQSRNIEDRRRVGGGGAGGRGLQIGGGGAVIVFLIAMFLGVDPSMLLGPDGMQQSGSGAPVELTEADQQAGEFVAVTLADTEEIWANIFRDQLNRDYNQTTLVLFKDQTRSACGGASEATGPFYCPADKRVYLDTSFFTTLSQRLGAKGDFAAAYVVAHEVGHHVQDELGILGQANQLRQQASEAQSNDISVRIELQADCLSGIWARAAALELGTIEPGDLEEAVNAARQIGDDTLQANAGRRPMPHTFTHGTSEQRSRWFTKGLNSGRLTDCDSFSTQRL